MTKAKAKTKAVTKAKARSDFLRDWQNQQEQEFMARKSLRKSCRQLVKLGVDIPTAQDWLSCLKPARWMMTAGQSTEFLNS